MTDRVYAEELAHDSGVKLTKHDLEEALDDLIDRLFEGKSVGGLHLDAYVEKFAEEIAAQFIRGEPQDRLSYIRSVLEMLIREDLSDNDAVRERAAELAQEGE
jgi:hypothetical protein